MRNSNDSPETLSFIFVKRYNDNEYSIVYIVIENRLGSSEFHSSFFTTLYIRIIQQKFTPSRCSAAEYYLTNITYVRLGVLPFQNSEYSPTDNVYYYASLDAEHHVDTLTFLSNSRAVRKGKTDKSHHKTKRTPNDNKTIKKLTVYKKEKKNIITNRVLQSVYIQSVCFTI